MFVEIPALSFSGTNVVNFGSNSLIDNLCMTRGTLITIFWRNTWANFTGGGSILKDTPGNTFQLSSGAGSPADVQILVDRATTDLRVSTTSPALPLISAQKWCVIAGVFDTTGANGDQKLFAGDFSNPIEEATSYVLQQVGSGAVTNTAALNLLVGNRASGAFPFPGSIAFVGAWNYVMNFFELRQQIDYIWAWLIGLVQIPILLPNAVLISHLGSNGSSICIDITGNNNPGVVTGCTPVLIGAQVNWIPL